MEDGIELKKLRSLEMGASDKQNEGQSETVPSMWGPTRVLINLEESAKAECGHCFVGFGLQHALSVVELD